MARNNVQFQKGLSLNEFLKEYGTEKQCFEALFNELFAFSDTELAKRLARRIVADVKCGYPSRVSLVDAEIGSAAI